MPQSKQGSGTQENVYMYIRFSVANYKQSPTG